MPATPTIADYVGKKFIAFSEAAQDSHGHGIPVVFDGLRVLDSKNGPVLESVIAFSDGNQPTTAKHIRLQDIIATVRDTESGWRIIDEAQTQSDETFKEQLDIARAALQKVIDQKHDATRLSIEIGAAAVNAVTQEASR